MDFVRKVRFDGSRFRSLPIVDICSREYLGMVVGKSVRGSGVVDALESIRLTRGLVPERIQPDNGSECLSRETDRWEYDHGYRWTMQGLANRRTTP